jgi:hypothetical protein
MTLVVTSAKITSPEGEVRELTPEEISSIEIKVSEELYDPSLSHILGGAVIGLSLFFSIGVIGFLIFAILGW